jgi:hypothetical protein
VKKLPSSSFTSSSRASPWLSILRPIPLNSQPTSKFFARLEANLPFHPRDQKQKGIGPPGKKTQGLHRETNPAL